MPSATTATAAAAKSLPVGNNFTGTFILRKNAAKTARNGAPFLNIELGDRTGSFSSTIFSDTPCFDTLAAAAEGAVLRIEASVDSYQGRFAPRLFGVALLDSNGLSAAELDALIERSPEDPDVMWAQFQECIAAIPHDAIRTVVKSVFDEHGALFRTSTAAIAMHHAYRNGLLEHTLHMALAARALLPLYPQIDPSLALAGILLHDVGKIQEYTQGLTTKMTRSGILHGHLIIGYQIVRKHGLINKLSPALLERLEHIILSHHSEPQFGTAKRPATPEAFFVAKIDDFDAKMGMIQKTLRNAPPGEEFSEKIFALETQLLLTPPATQPAE
jgi:3'-5' exoribonuclease